MWMPSIKCSVAHILQGKPAPAHLAEEAGTSYMVKLKCGLVTDRVWVQVRPPARDTALARARSCGRPYPAQLCAQQIGRQSH